MISRDSAWPPQNMLQIFLSPLAPDEVEDRDDPVGHPAHQEGHVHPEDQDADLHLASPGSPTNALVIRRDGFLRI